MPTLLKRHYMSKTPTRKLLLFAILLSLFQIPSCNLNITLTGDLLGARDRLGDPPLNCGDSVIDAGETCDTGGNSATCDSDCTTPVCGDFLLNTAAGEICDDGNTITEVCAYGATSCTVCDATCQSVAGATSFCGDGAVDAGNSETCDDGNTITEVCAYGTPSCTVCDATCQSVAGVTTFCGDGVINGPESCDDGNTNNGDGCSATCVPEACTSFFTRDDSTWDALYGTAPTSYANAGAAGGSFSGQAADSSGYQYNFSAMCAGTYYVWVNCFDIGGSTDKSYGYWNFAGDSNPPVAHKMLVYDAFGWKKSSAVALGTGNHTWQFGAMSDGNWFTVGWDQIVVTQNANYVPSPGIVPNPLVTDSLDTFNGWANNSGGALVATTDNTPAVGAGNIKTTGSSGHYLGLKKTFAASQPTYMGVWMRQDSAGTGPYLVAGGSNVTNANVVVFLYFTGGNITVSQAAGITLQPYVIGQWYFIEIKNINYTTFTMDFYVNGVLRAAGAGFRTNQTSMQEVHFYSLGAGASYDDLVIY